MEPERQTYKGHLIELHELAGGAEAKRMDAAELELLIDDEPVRYGRLPDDAFFLHDYAYDWHEDLLALSRNYIDYRENADVRHRRASGPVEH